MKKAIIIDKALLEQELMDARSQRDQARIMLGNAQNAQSQAMTNIARIDGAEAQLLALLEKIKDEKPDPAPAS